MNLNLYVLSEGNTEGKKIPVTLPQFLIGRDRQCHLRPVSTLISKRHCAFLVQPDGVRLQDLDSTNGTFINEERIQGLHDLSNGDVVKAGPLTFRVEIEQPVAVDQPTPPPGKPLAPAMNMPAADEKPMEDYSVPEQPPMEDYSIPEEEPDSATMDAPTEQVPAVSESAEVEEPVAEEPIPESPPEQTQPAEDFELDDEDDFAALLMGDGGNTADVGALSEEIADETTMMEMEMPPELLEKHKQEQKEKEEAAKKQEEANTSNAAADILNQMYRRR